MSDQPLTFTPLRPEEPAKPAATPTDRRWRWEHSFLLVLLVGSATGIGVRPDIAGEYGRAVTCAALFHHYLERGDDAERAIAIADRLREYRREDPRYQGALGFLLIEQHLAAGTSGAGKVLADLLRGGSVQAGDPRVLLALGMGHQAAGGNERAIAYLEAALRRAAPGDSLDREIRLRLAYAYQEAGRADDAAPIYESLAEAYPDDSTVLNSLGYFLAEADRELQRAEALIERALRLNRRAVGPRLAQPDAWRERQASYVDSLGWVYYRQNRLDEAEEQLLLASELTSLAPSGEILYHLAQLYFDRGQDARAARYLEQALAIDPDYGPARRLRDQLDSERRRNRIIGLPGAGGLPARALEVQPRHAQRRQA